MTRRRRRWIVRRHGAHARAAWLVQTSIDNGWHYVTVFPTWAEAVAHAVRAADHDRAVALAAVESAEGLEVPC